MPRFILSSSPLDWCVQSNMTTLASYHARPGILNRNLSELHCSVSIEKVKPSTGTMFEAVCDRCNATILVHGVWRGNPSPG